MYDKQIDKDIQEAANIADIPRIELAEGPKGEDDDKWLADMNNGIKEAYIAGRIAEREYQQQQR